MLSIDLALCSFDGSKTFTYPACDVVATSHLGLI